MSFSYRIRRKLIRRVALGLAVAAVAAPSALATEPMYHGAGLSGGTAYGALHQFPDAGLAAASAYGALHQFPNAGLRTNIGIGPQVHVTPRAGIVTGNLPAHSVDGPRSGPANVTETPVLIGGRFGRPDLAPNTGTASNVEVAWPELGVGLGIGTVVALGLAALAFGMTRRRGTLQGA
jgi:hypothetical protein